ncbi:Dps family protein [Paenibacillus sp. GCM10012307]|uniref:DNA starvation/stationary phase protection protein n=1 Tax=Paenibacillus roseus TaxID=2798579 RepID=A0A934J333_9BACL|nr:Dps family protein [Paenibacillus roseus]MBJ6361890.1 DNA starvation/stationary phase protection protein [Paenibacillus roseus]
MATHAPEKRQHSLEVIGKLNRQVANWSVLYMKLHHFHWYVKGPHFFTLHEKFEELYNEAALIVDELAERVLTLGGKPTSTLKEQLSLASIREAEGGESAIEMIKQLTADLQQLAAESKEIAEAADEVGDAPTADMLVGRQEWIEKTVWMLKAYQEA